MGKSHFMYVVFALYAFALSSLRVVLQVRCREGMSLFKPLSAKDLSVCTLGKFRLGVSI